jgi:hypothetical protein
MDYPEDPEYADDDVLQQYLDEEGLALVPIEFMRELMLLMEAHIENVCGIDREELNDVMVRLEDLLGEDGMMDLSIDGIIDWVNTLKQA